MTKDSIEVLLKMLGSRGIRESSGWVTGTCIFEQWKHRHGVDKTPSFGVKIENEKPSTYHCFSCESHGSLLKLIPSLWFFTGIYPTELAKFITEHENFGQEEVDLDTIRTHPLELKKPSALLAVPDEVLDRLSLVDPGDGVCEYLTEERKIELEFIFRYSLRVYTQPGSERLGVVFPIITKTGKVVDMYVRSISSKIFFRLNATITNSDVDYHASHLLFGCQHLDRNKPIWLCEGPLDALRLASLGVSNVAAMCGGPKTAQLANLYAPKGLVLAFDADEAGWGFAKKVIKQSTAKTFHVLDFGVVGKKDPGDLDSREELEEVLRKRRVIMK